MKNSSRGYPIKRFKKILRAALVSIGVFTLTVNVLLWTSKLTFLSSGGFLGRTYKLGGILYLPPHFILAHNAVLYEPGRPADPLLRIPLAIARFSLPESLRGKRPVLSRISCYSPHMQQEQFLVFLKEKGKELVDFLRSFPPQDIDIGIRGVRLLSLAAHDEMRLVGTDIFLQVAGGQLSGEGVLRFGQPDTPGGKIRHHMPAAYSFKTSGFSDSMFIIESLRIWRKNFYLDTRGSIRENELSFRGYSFINSSYDEEEYHRPRLTLRGLIKRLLWGMQTPLPELELSDADLFVLDIGGSMLLDFPHLRVDTLKCSINNIPVSLTGTIRFDEGVSLDGVLSVFFAKALPAQHTEKFREMSLSFKGRLRDKVVEGGGILDLSFNARDAASPLERLQLSFSGARYDFGRLKRQIISLEAVAVECETGSNLYQIELHDLYAALRLEGKKSYDAGLRADCSSGELTGKARIDMEDFPPRVDATLRLNGVEANELRGLLVHFSKVRGSLFSQMKFSTYPRASLRGDISINEGSLRDFEFFKWLSDRFHLSSLRRIDFRRASFNFAVDERGARMQDIRLDSPDALIAGFFHLGESDMVTSKISLSLSKPVLRESRKFRRLLSLLRKDDPAYLQFDFQLSGLLHGMNFKWLESHFKRELQRRIPNFIERRLEQGIEDLLTGE